MGMINILIHIISACLIAKTGANKFEPYTLNGGLVSAIAGKNYVILACDTRLSDGGYNILSREYFGSRLWSATDSGCNSDGSIILPENEASGSNDHETTFSGILRSRTVLTNQRCPTFIASSGCAADCDALKRQVRSEVDAHQNWNFASNLTPTGIANMLGQILYSRRAFPFYSFCVCAGLENHGHGHVHIYDAIGSHERVAVACTGAGKEMLQPILDRMFARANKKCTDDNYPEYSSIHLQRDGQAVRASDQRIGLQLQPPVKTYVSCDEEEALTMLVKGYRSAAEREITIGDSVVAIVLKRRSSSSESFEMDIMRFPLKQH